MKNLKEFFENFQKDKKVDPSKVKEEEPNNKKAILIGLNYENSYYSLKGCANDVINGSKFLKAHGYEVHTLFDKDLSEEYNVLEALKELVTSHKKNLFFHYSGHGTQSKDTDGDEIDGYDEVLYSKGDTLITDDQINEMLTKFPKDKVVILVFDCCHSGSIADLPYILSLFPNKYIEEKVKKPVAARVLCISGCKDFQTSADISSMGVSYGALSETVFNLLKKAEKKGDTWRDFYIDLVYEMHNKRYEQVPMISASDPSIFEEKISF